MLPGQATCCRICWRQHVARQQVARSGNMNFVDKQHVEEDMHNIKSGANANLSAAGRPISPDVFFL